MGAFNHALLKVARESRGWPQAQLADRAGLTQGNISRYEKGLQSPRSEHVDRLAAALGFRSAFFEDGDARPAAVLYRSKSLRSAKLETKVRARLNLARLVARGLLEDIDIDSVASFPPPDGALGNPEQAARALRQLWWVAPGPVGNVGELIELAGGVVLRIDMGADEVVAAYMHPMGDQTRWFFVNTRVGAGDRVRFALCHELGHALLHEVELLPDTAEAERESHAFAGALLLPREELLRELPTGRLRIRDLYELKSRWGVAMQAIAVRAEAIGAITRDQLSRLFKELNYRGYRTSEPGYVPVEEPIAFSQALAIHRQDHGLRDEDLARMVCVTPRVLHELFPENFKPDPRSNLRLIGGSRDEPRAATG